MSLETFSLTGSNNLSVVPLMWSDGMVIWILESTERYRVAARREVSYKSSKPRVLFSRSSPFKMAFDPAFLRIQPAMARRRGLVVDDDGLSVVQQEGVFRSSYQQIPQ